MRETIIAKFPFGFNGMEMDDELEGDGSSINYEARLLNTRLGRFLSIDPRTKQFPMLTPYQFASNTPVWGIDLDGEEVRIYTESPSYLTLNVGHTFVTVGNAEEVVVYTYGRYAEIDAPSGGHSGSLNPLSSSGQGVLIRLTGVKAQDFIKKAFETEEVNVYEITDANETMTAAYFENLFNGPTATVPTEGKYAGNSDARVVDQYDLGNNNCATKTCEGVLAGGSRIFRETTQEVKKTQMYKSGMDYEYRVVGTGQYQTSSIEAQSPSSPGGVKRMLDYQDQASQNPVSNVTNDVKKQVTGEN